MATRGDIDLATYGDFLMAMGRAAEHWRAAHEARRSPVRRGGFERARAEGELRAATSGPSVS